MYKSLLISSFRGLRDLKMDDLARVNLISGSNNIGKTAVLEAILLLAAGPLAGRIALDMIRPFRGSPSLPITGGLEGGPWDFIFPNLDSSSEIRLESMTDEGSYNLTLSIPGNLTASQSAAVKLGDAASMEFWKRSIQISEKRDAQAFQNYTESITVRGSAGQLEINFVTDPPVSQPPQPGFLRGGITKAGTEELAERYSRLRSGGERGQFLESMRIIEPRIKGVEILIYEGRPVLHVDFGSRLPLPLPLLGAGMTAFVDCIMLFQDAAGGVILLDEVEGGVYYRALPALWQRLGELAERFNVQLFATTHSRECLLAAHQSLGKRPGLVNLLRLSPSQDNSEKTEVVAYDSELLAAALLKHEAFDDLFTFLKDLPEGARSN